MIPTLVASQLLGLGHDLVLLQLQLQSFDSMTRTSVVLHCALLGYHPRELCPATHVRVHDSNEAERNT
jgi:hypothetical protein